MAQQSEPRIVFNPQINQPEVPVLISVFPGLGFDQILRLIELSLRLYPEKAVAIIGVTDQPDKREDSP